MPTFDELDEQHLDDEVLDWLTHVLTVIETLDARAYAELMIDDVELRLEEGTVLRGRERVAQALEAAWAGLSRIEHQERNMWGDRRQVVHEARIEIEGDDGATVVSHGTSWINRAEDGRISSARIYS